MAQLVHDYPADTIVNRMLVPVARAWLDLGAHRPQAILHDLEGTEPFDVVTTAEYLRGLACLEAHDGPRAVVAFQKEIRYRGGAVLTSLQDYGQAELGLARAYVLAGDRTSAKKTYEALFNIWQQADADLPQLVAAKKEYAALK